MTRIFFINRYFYPDHSATSQLLTDLAFTLAANSFEIHIIASRQLYGQPNSQLSMWEKISGVEVHRVFSTRFGRSALLGRAIDYLSFYASTYSQLSKLARDGDIVVAKTDPPLMSIIASHVGVRRRAKVINWLQDVYPEVAIALKVPLLRGAVGRVLTRWRDASLRKAECNVALGERMTELLQGRPFLEGKVATIQNWADDDRIQPIERDLNPFRVTWGLQGKFVVGYSGNLGRAHEYDTLIAAAKLLQHRGDLIFLFIGAGHHVAALEERVKEQGLGRQFRFVPYQEHTQLQFSLGAADVHWISLRAELEGLIVPSKLYGVAAAGRPIIAVTDGDGEVARVVRRFECGLQVTPGDGEGLAAAIARLAADDDLRARLGRNARSMIDTHFSRTLALKRWTELLTRVGAS